jgi:predicted nucleotide-binding protein
MNPKAFIGSSVKGLDLARAIQQELHDDIECTVWNQGIFQPGKTPIEDLIRAVNEHDFAIFVFLPEDVVTIRDRTFEAVRDNVVFELGLFIGKLGRDRNIFVMPEGEENVRIASDLAGIAPATYRPDARNLQVAVASACFHTRNRLRELGIAERTLYNSERELRPHHS